MGAFKNMVENFRRFQELKKKLNPNNDSFIEVENTPDWKEFNELSIKLMPMYKAMGAENRKVLEDSIEVHEEIKKMKTLN
jgi:hypothetical protein